MASTGSGCEVVDVAFFPLRGLFLDMLPHIRKVEEQSDAYHLEIGDNDVIVAYLLRITWTGSGLDRPKG